MIEQIINNLKINKFITDVSSLLSSRIVILGISFMTSIIVARVLGPDKKGLLTFLLVVPNLVLSFADLGIRQATAYYLGKGIYSEQTVISTISFLGIVTSVISMFTVIIVYIILGYPQQYGWGLVGLSLMVLPVTLIASYGTGVLLAKQDIQKIAISNLISKSLYLLLLLPLFFINRALVAYALIALITSFAINAAYIVLIVRRYGQINPAYIPGMPVEFIKKGVVYALALFVLSLNYRVDVVILERLSSTYEVGIYSIGVTIAELLWILPTALTTVNFARSASAKNALSYSKKTALVLRLTLVLTLLPVLGLYLLSPWVIPLVYGADFAAGGFVVQAILPGVWLSVIFKVLNSDLAGRGRPEAALWVYILAVAINVVLNVMWAPRYGALGSAWASSVSYSVGAIIFAVAYARMSHVSFRELFVPKVEDFRRLLGAAR